MGNGRKHGSRHGSHGSHGSYGSYGRHVGEIIRGLEGQSSRPLLLIRAELSNTFLPLQERGFTGVITDYSNNGASSQGLPGELRLEIENDYWNTGLTLQFLVGVFVSLGSITYGYDLGVVAEVSM